MKIGIFSMKYISLLLACVALSAQSIEEKLGGLSSDQGETREFDQSLATANETIHSLRLELADLYSDVNTSMSEDDSLELLDRVNQIKSEISLQETAFREMAASERRNDEEGYGLWDEEETTLSQLVMEYGSGDYLYQIPNDVANMKLSLHSSVPIPRESWSSLLEILLAQNGVGIKEVNAYTRKLYQFKSDLMAIDTIVCHEKALEKLPDTSRLVYVFSPEIENLKSAFHFFERFRDPKITFVYTVGNKIAIVSLKDEVRKLLQLYDAIWEKSNQKVTRVIPLKKMNFTEMQKILKSFFGTLSDGNRFSMAKGGNELSVHPLAKDGGIVLVGSSEVVSKAEDVIIETEAQIDDPLEMTVEWYNCRHSDPLDLSEVLDKVYASLIRHKMSDEGAANEINQSVNVEVNEAENDPLPFDAPHGVNPVTPPPVQPGTVEQQTRKSRSTNFIPYAKTGALMMVVRRDTLPKLKELIRKLDIPKKMVQIEVLLCERKLNHQTNTGLNLLKLGAAASGNTETGASYNNPSFEKGIFQFFASKGKNHGFPAFDITYNFLLSQEDVRINASPSIMTVNQTPATISIVEEISVNNGAAPLETNSNITFERSYSREQFGITIVMTPTVHDAGETDETATVSMETNVTFDTIKSDKDDRPNVNRRHIENQVRVSDGQTVVIGGLRRKNADDTSEKIPFLGEIPGIAKLFGTSKMTDQLTEMFIFITPKIVDDPARDLDKMRETELMKRAGDLPEFMERVIEAQNKKHDKLFQQSFQLFFGNSD